MIDKEKLVLDNEFIIYSVINKYTNFFDKDDLYQVGMIGLIDAVNHYKDNKDTKFSSFAYFYVKGEVTKYLRESNVLKVSRDLIKLNSSIEKARDYLTQKVGHVPTTSELSMFLEIEEEKLVEAQNANSLVESLDKETEEETEIYNFYGYEEKSYKEELLDLRNELASLNEFDKRLIEKRYNEGLTQSEVSKELGINQVKVSRQEKQILTKLRTRLR